MSLYRTSMLTLNVLQNVQQAQTNRKLQSLIDAKQSDEQRRLAASGIKDALYQAAKAFKEGQDNDALLPRRLYAALAFEGWCSELGVSSGSFDDFRDKDFFGETVATAKEIVASARANLPADDFEAVRLLVLTPSQMALLDAGQAWEAAKVGMVGGKWIWNGFPGFLIGIVTTCVFPVPALGYVLDEVLHIRGVEPLIQLLVMVSIGGTLWMLIWRKRRAAQLNALVRPYGGAFTSRAREKEVNQICEEFRSVIVHPWAPLKSGWAKAKEALVARAKREAARLSIPDDYIFE